MAESNRIEYKRELNDSFEKEVVAFLNYHDGGIIYLGIDKDGFAHGVNNADQLQLIIVKGRLRNNIQPSIMGLFDIIIEQRESKEIIRITVAGGQEKPYYLKNIWHDGKRLLHPSRQCIRTHAAGNDRFAV